MSHHAVILILASSIIHAWWNLISKRAHPTAGFFLIANATGAVILLPGALAGPLDLLSIPPRVWILLAFTGAFQALYCVSLAAAYRRGDLSVCYPVARSLPVVLVPLATALLGRGALLGPLFPAGAVLVLAGIALVSARDLIPRFADRLPTGALPMAFLAAVGTAGYSMADDRALRILRGLAAGSHGTVRVTLMYAPLEAAACTSWILIFLLLRRGGAGEPRFSPARAAGTGVLMYATYVLVLLAMAYARDVSLIVAFRQTSVLLGAALGIVFLREPAIASRIAGLVVLFAGLVLVALA